MLNWVFFNVMGLYYNLIRSMGTFRLYYNVMGTLIGMSELAAINAPCPDDAEGAPAAVETS